MPNRPRDIVVFLGRCLIYDPLVRPMTARQGVIGDTQMKLAAPYRVRLTKPLMALALLGLGAGGCATHSVPQANIDQRMPEHLQLAMDSQQPTFGVGDELGWLAFGDLALAPQPGEPTNVLVVAQAEPVEDALYDWVGTYLALAK